VEDNAILLEVIAGFDSRDPYSTDRPTDDFTRDLRRDIRGGTIGVPANFYFEHVESEVEDRVKEAIEVFRSLGTRIREVELPCVEKTLKAQRLIFAAESYAVHRNRLESTPEKFDEEVRKYLVAGERLKAHRYVVAQQNKLQALEEFERVLDGVDVLLTPTVPVAAPELGKREIEIGGHREHVDAALTRLTGPTNLIGLPSLSVSCGVSASGLPIGLQIIGSQFEEATIYRYGHVYENALS
jgi:aspartyl-tRNA(Asn)/glutamyl-tRNA(Gln) amidotransferase subunit A